MLKIRGLIIIFFYFYILSLLGCAERDIKNIEARGKNIICFGDSITFGYGAGPGEDYPSALANMTDIPVINAGIDGDTSSEGLKRIKSDVLDRDPLLVIVEFGGNDFLREIPCAETEKHVREMVDKIQESGAMAAVADISATILLREYREAFYNIAKEKKAIYIPSIFNGIVTNPNFKSDFIHPNKDGYKIIAYRVYRAIMPYLNKNRLLRSMQR